LEKPVITLIMGLPGSGKTTLARKLVKAQDAIHLNADDVRKDLNSDLGFSLGDRVENARRLGAMARLLNQQGYEVVVDFVNPTEETRKAFGTAHYVIWMDTISAGRFEDTNALWQSPTEWDERVTDFKE
jgi:adenylylsulfate kinase